MGLSLERSKETSFLDKQRQAARAPRARSGTRTGCGGRGPLWPPGPQGTKPQDTPLCGPDTGLPFPSCGGRRDPVTNPQMAITASRGSPLLQEKVHTPPPARQLGRTLRPPARLLPCCFLHPVPSVPLTLNLAPPRPSSPKPPRLSALPGALSPSLASRDSLPQVAISCQHPPTTVECRSTEDMGPQTPQPCAGPPAPSLPSPTSQNKPSCPSGSSPCPLPTTWVGS